MIALAGINDHLARKSQIYPFHPTCKTGAHNCASEREKIIIQSFCSSVKLNGQSNLISFSCHNMLKKRDNRQFEIHGSEPCIRRQLILFISYPLIPPCLQLRPPVFSCRTNYRSISLRVGEQGFGDAAEGEEISLVLNQTTSSILPLSHPSPFSCLSLLPQSLGCNSLTRVLYLMTCESN